MKRLPLLLFSLCFSCSFTSSEFICTSDETQEGKVCQDGVWVNTSTPTPDSGMDLGSRDMDKKEDMISDMKVPSCGDGTLDANEECDGTPTKTCAELGFAGGTLHCTSTCTFDTASCEAPPNCGNGQLDNDEACDAEKFGMNTCESNGFNGGTLKCDKCVLETSGCFKCGDDKLNMGETCDGSDLNNKTCLSEGFSGGDLTCAADCQSFETEKCSECKNGVLETDEVCDEDMFPGDPTCSSILGYEAIGDLGCRECKQITTNECKPVFTQVSAGRDHTCGLKSDGSVVCWGENDEGQTNVPIGVFKYVGAANEHTCGLLESGEIRCWGDNTDNRVSGAPAGLHQALSVGLDHACAISDVGTISCWGRTSDGRTNSPAGTYDQISVLEGHGCALTNGVITTWGRAGDGRDVPDGIGLVESIHAGRRFTCVRMVGGQIRCFGTPGSYLDAPFGTYSQMDSNRYHNCAIGSISGFASCWGSSNDGRSTPPTPAVAYSQISAGNKHTCAVRMDGGIDCWGEPNNRKTIPPSL